MPRTVYRITPPDFSALADSRAIVDSGIDIIRCGSNFPILDSSRLHLIDSGSLRFDPSGESDPNAVIPRVPNWSHAAWDLFSDRLAAARSRGVRLALRPNARHIVSDVPSSARVLRYLAEQPPAPGRAPCGVLFDPVAILPPDESRPAVLADLVSRAFQAVPDLAALGPLTGVVYQRHPAIDDDLMVQLAAGLPIEVALAHPINTPFPPALFG